MRKIITIDCGYLRPKFAASFLLIDSDTNGETRAAFIETNTAHSVPRLLDALKAEGLKPSQVDYVIITHVHLDHAGGASQLMKACPNATLLAHPRAATHMIDPTKLVSSARKVYGDQEFDRLYGSIEPIPAERVRTVADEEKIRFGSSELTFLHTRGHANHHFCIYDKESHSIFTGDSFGLAYPVLQEKALFIFPSTSPTDFDATEAVKSAKRIANSGATAAYLTHYGAIENLFEAAGQLISHLKFAERTMKDAIDSSLFDQELEGFIEPKLREFFAARMGDAGITPTPDIWELLRLDIELNAQGLAHVARKTRHAADPQPKK